MRTMRRFWVAGSACGVRSWSAKAWTALSRWNKATIRSRRAQPGLPASASSSDSSPSPLLAATAIGAALGAVGGKALHKKIGSGVERMAEETIPIGGAGLIVAYPRSAAQKVEPAVTRALQKVVGEAEGHHVKALKGALADAQKKMAEEGAEGKG